MNVQNFWQIFMALLDLNMGLEGVREGAFESSLNLWFSFQITLENLRNLLKLLKMFLHTILVSAHN